MASTREYGVSLVELAIAVAVLTIALFTITTRSIQGVQRLNDMTGVVVKQARAGELAHAIEKRLRGAVGHKPAAWVVEELLQGDAASVLVDSLRGFPDAGVLQIAPGTAGTERIRYEQVADVDGYRAFEQLTRGLRTGVAGRHGVGAAVRWAAFGEVLQGTPAPGTFDGISASVGGPVHFRGDGTGFCFQRTVVVGGERRLGAVIGAAAHADGWYALYFEPVAELREAERGIDLDRDGDETGVFDLGRLRLRSWAPPAAGGSFDDIAVSPAAVVQERDRWGAADLDGDGAADPLFLWHEDASKVQVQLVLWGGAASGAAQFTKVESTVRLDRAR